MHMRHNIVAELRFLFIGQLEVDVVQMSPHVFQLLVQDIQT